MLFFIGLIVAIFIQMQFFSKSDKPTVGQEVVATGKEVLATFQTISDGDTKSLVGLSTGELRQRLGKPDDVDVPYVRLWSVLLSGCGGSIF